MSNNVATGQVMTANIYTINKGKLIVLSGASNNVVTNTLIAGTSAPRGPRVETIDLMDSTLGAAGAGVEKGTAGSSNSTVSDLSKTLGLMGKVNDAFAVVQHAAQGNGAETATELAGVYGGAAGAYAGFKFGLLFVEVPFVGPFLPIVSGGLGAFGVGEALKAAGNFLTGGNTPDKLGPPLTLPNDMALKPTVIDGAGNAYALVNVDGKFTWFAMLNNNTVANRYVEVTSGSKASDLTSDYLQKAGFSGQLQDLKKRIDIAAANGELDTKSSGPAVVDLGEITIIGKRGDSINETTTPRNSASYITDDSANDHAVVIKTGGTVWDIYALQKNDSTGFKSWDEFKEAIAASNPNIADLNKIPAGTTLYLPEKFKDGSITYNYANGVSLNSNRVNGEYHMVVPDGAGGTIVYSRKADDFGYTVREVHTDKTGGVTLDYTGTQATLDAEIKPLGFEWSNSQETGKVQVFANNSSITSVEDKVTGDITETVKDSQQNVVESKTYDNHTARVEAAQQNALLAGVELFDAIRHKNNLGAISAVTRLVNESRIAADQPIVFAPQVGAVLGLIGALDSFGDAKTDAQKFVATARLVLSANTTYAAFNEGKSFLDAGTDLTALNVAGGVLALANLDSTLKSKNPFAIASSFMVLTNAAVATGLVTSATAAGALGTSAFSSAAVFGPQAMIAVAIASIVFGSLFGGSVEYPEPPPAGTVEIGALADGTLGMLLKDADGKVYQTRKLTGAVVSNTGKDTDTQNWAMGADVLSQRMSALIGDLQAQAAKDGTHLVLDRLPMLTVVAYPSFDRNGVDNFFFAIRFNDPGTGAQQMMAAANQDMAKQFKEMAGYAGAVVGATEWAQIQAKKAAGDSFATETEGQYVDRLSGTKEGDSVQSKAQADAQEASNRQTYSLLTLDLEGNGITRKAQQASGMSLEDVQADTTKGVTRLNLGNYSLRQTIPCIRSEWMRLRKSSATATVGSFYQHSRTHPTIPRQPEQQAALPGYRAELPQSEADIRAFDAAVRQLITPTVQLLMDDIQGVRAMK